MLTGISTQNALNALATGGGIIAGNLIANAAGARFDPNIADVLTVVAGMVVIGVGSGPVRAVGAGIAGVAAARLVGRNFLTV
jgi:hypothetical protein